jgi:hypothetical protein
VRSVLWLVIAAGCGRLDFEPTAARLGGDAAADGASLDPSLVAWYPMDDVTSGTVIDATGHGHDATCTACPQPATGVVGGALHFDGSNELVAVPDAPDLDTSSAFTLAAWYEPDSFNDAGQFDCFMGKLFGSANSNTWQFCVTPQTRLTAGIGSGSGSDFTLDSILGPTTTAGDWHHAALAYDGSRIEVFFDGVSLGSASATGALMLDHGEITLGGDLDSGAPIAMFPGRVDDVRIYARVLAASEIATLATRP